MKPTQKELTFEESVKQVMQTLPPPIRSYLTQGKYTVVAKGLMTKYGLRIDQAGVLEREIMLLLMGIDNPDEFAASLKSDASLADDTVRNIMNDVNQQIFVPLRDEMRKVGAMSPPAPSGRVPEIPGVKPEPGPGQPESLFHLQNKIPAPVSSQPSVQVRPTAPTPRPASPTPPAAGGRSSLRDVLASITKTPGSIHNSMLLEDHEEPHIELGASDKVQGARNQVPLKPSTLPLTPAVSKPSTLPLTPAATPPRPTPPAPPVLPRPMVPPAPTKPSDLPPTSYPLQPAPVPANLPGVVQPHIIPAGGRPEVTFHKPESALAPKPTPPAVPAAPKAYAADPYREPIEP